MDTDVISSSYVTADSSAKIIATKYRQPHVYPQMQDFFKGYLKFFYVNWQEIHVATFVTKHLIHTNTAPKFRLFCSTVFKHTLSNVPVYEVQCLRKVAVHLDLWGAAKSAVYRDRPRTLNELKLQ
jgi:hypothetical protein